MLPDSSGGSAKGWITLPSCPSASRSGFNRESDTLKSAIAWVRKAGWLWHACSLDAPLVGALWAVFLARSLHAVVKPVEIIVLSLGIWLVYVADRMLDVWLSRSSENLRARHFFYQRHWRTFSLVFGLVLGNALYLSFGAMDRRVLRADSTLLVVTGLYFWAVHAAPSVVRTQFARMFGAWNVKRGAVAAIFAAGTLLPSCAHGGWGRQWGLQAILEGLAFAALCWLNCWVIDVWERGGVRSKSLPRYSLATWAKGHSSFCVMAMVPAATFLEIDFRPAGPVYAACILSCLALAFIHERRRELRAEELRLLADVVLLTPVLVLPFLGAR